MGTRRSVLNFIDGHAIRHGSTLPSASKFPYIGQPALIANKKSAGRHKDLADVEEHDVQIVVRPFSGPSSLVMSQVHT